MEQNSFYGRRGVIKLKSRIKISSASAVGGKKESEGPIGKYLDIYYDKADLGKDSWEKAESEMCRQALNTAMSKIKFRDENLDCIIGGDLINQCTSTGYGLDSFDVPYFGLYGACSTMAEGIIIGSILIESGHMNSVAVVVSSHFCSAERQFRYPLGYGSFSGPTAQSTVTGAGAVILTRASEDETGVFVEELVPGIVCDRGIKDAGNMGAAMCSAAADTILRYFSTSDKKTTDFDTIATGDLGWEGLKLLCTLLDDKGIRDKGRFSDCGLIVYDITKQDVGCGGSGCGCSAVCTAGYFYNRLLSGEANRVAVVGTGAMMSPQSLKQGLSIPAVAHLVTLVRHASE